VTRLDNFNFPVSKTFAWSAQGCAETTLEVRFRNLVLQKVYTGSYGFPDFLADFADGQRTFTPEDFPEQAQQMRSQGLEALNVRWNLQDAAAVQTLAHELQETTQALGQRQSALREARERDLQQASLRATGAAGVGLVPAHIADACWQPVPSAVLYAAKQVPPAAAESKSALSRSPAPITRTQMGKT